MKIYVSFNMADYTENLLQDKDNVTVLAWIEKSGTISEQELISELKIRQGKLNTVLLKLYNNQLISIFDNNYKISVRGKEILDRLKISDNIVNYVCSFLPLKLNTKKLFATSLIQYRHQHFDDYLHMQGSLKLWTRILECREFKNVDESFKQNSISALICLGTISLSDETWDYADGRNYDKKSLTDIELDTPSENKTRIGKITAKPYILRDLSTLWIKADFEKDFNDLPFEKREFYEFLHYRDLLKHSKLETKFNNIFQVYYKKDLNENTFFSYTKFKEYCKKELEIKPILRKVYLDASARVHNKDLENIYAISFLLKQFHRMSDFAENLQVPIDIIESTLCDIADNIKRLQRN